MFSAAFWSDKLMDWAMQDEAFKVQLFRFVDAFPRLKTADEVPNTVHRPALAPRWMELATVRVTMGPGIRIKTQVAATKAR